MKHKILFTFLLLWFGSVFSQPSGDKIIYLDSLGIPSTGNNFTRKRIIKNYYKNQDKYEVNEYFKSGNISFNGTTRDKDIMRYVGISSYYYENGNGKKIITFGNSDPSLIWKSFEWYENGEKKSEVEFVSKKESYHTGNEYGTRPKSELRF